MPDDASWLERVVVPDDLSELQTDVEAYYREQRAAARHRRLARITASRAVQRFALPAAVVIGSLAVAGAVLAILTLGHPHRVPGPPRVAVATAPAAAPGQVNGLVPDVMLRTSAGAMSARDLRPALVALVPLRCDCTSLLSTLAGQAEEVRLPLVVVAPAGHDAEVDALPGQLHHGDVRTAFDLIGALRETYGADGATVTVIGLRPDATVSFVQHGVSTDDRLELWLEQMVRPSASLSAS